MEKVTQATCISRWLVEDRLNRQNVCAVIWYGSTCSGCLHLFDPLHGDARSQMESCVPGHLDKYLLGL